MNNNRAYQQVSLKDLVARLKQINEEKSKLETEFNEIALELWNRIPSISLEKTKKLEMQNNK